jgi:hypothetical protein
MVPSAFELVSGAIITILTSEAIMNRALIRSTPFRYYVVLNNVVIFWSFRRVRCEIIADLINNAIKSEVLYEKAKNQK